MSLLPKSIHRCRRYPTKFNSGRDIPLLDFGLAKLHATGSGPDLSALPTEGKPLTKEGSILGTFQYIAPEQLEGKEADARTDIFAFGAVLYETVTGRRAFEGKSQASLIGCPTSSNHGVGSRFNFQLKLAHFRWDGAETVGDHQLQRRVCTSWLSTLLAKRDAPGPAI